MITVDPQRAGRSSDTGAGSPSAEYDYADMANGEGWTLFAGVMLLTAATLNIIAAISNSTFFTENARYGLIVHGKRSSLA